MYLNFLLFFVLLACNSGQKPAISMAKTTESGNSSNYLTMKINGKDWTADRDILAAFHPKGYNKLIMIAGSLGKKDRDEKTFNINIYNTTGPGMYSFVQGNKDLSEAQIGNWTAEDYICGNIMGFDMNVNVTKASSNPTIVEATFTGTMTCPASPAIKVTEGKFYYHE
ncbi:MAG: hypothetical protein IPO92_04535 [Saprospiraceae bacterium]|nr:hypothetical protein [Saprospiraceae bacterium]